MKQIVKSRRCARSLRLTYRKGIPRPNDLALARRCSRPFSSRRQHTVIDSTIMLEKIRLCREGADFISGSSPPPTSRNPPSCTSRIFMSTKMLPSPDAHAGRSFGGAHLGWKSEVIRGGYPTRSAIYITSDREHRRRRIFDRYLL